MTPAPDLLRSEPDDQITSAHDEKLYDLVFEHSTDTESGQSALLTYVLQDQSEAPGGCLRGTS